MVSLFNFGAILIASAKAWLGSKLGLSFSNFVTILYALRAASSVAKVYLALFVSFRKQWIGETDGYSSPAEIDSVYLICPSLSWQQ